MSKREVWARARSRSDVPLCLRGAQVFWGWLILRVLYKLVRDGHVEDNRSDDDEDKEAKQNEKKD